MMSGTIVMKRKGDPAGNSVKKVKKVGDDISKKILSKYDKINEELNKAVATYLGDSDVKVETENESEKFSELIRSKISDLDEDDDSDYEPEDGMISPDSRVATESPLLKSKFKDVKKNFVDCGSDVDQVARNIKRVIIGDVARIESQVVGSLKRKNKEIQDLNEKVEKCESEKASYATKYKKYKEMAIKLSVNGNGSANKDLEEENEGLRDKLKSVLDKLGNAEESKCDVSSKLALKDMMLKEQVQKNQDLEVKIKNFVTRFFEKMDSSPKDGAATNLNKSMEESQITSFLENSNKSLHKEISSKFALNSQKCSDSYTSSIIDHSPKIKQVQVKLLNVGANGLKKGTCLAKGNFRSKNKFKEATTGRHSLSFGVLEDKQVKSASIQKLIDENDKKVAEPASDDDESYDADQIDKEETKKKRKIQIHDLSNEISKKKFEIKRLSNGISSPIAKINPKSTSGSFEILPSEDDESEVPLRVKIINTSTEVYAKSIGEEVKLLRVPNKDKDLGKSPKSINPNSKVSVQKKSGNNLPSKLLSNSSISIERSLDAPKIAPVKQVEKVAEVPFNLPGISFSKSSSSSASNSPRVPSKKGRTDALLMNSSLSLNKVDKTASLSTSPLTKATPASMVNNSKISFSKLPAGQVSAKSSMSLDGIKEIKDNPILNNFNLSITKPAESNPSPKPSPSSRKPRRESLSTNSKLSISKSIGALVKVDVEDSTKEKLSSLQSNSSISISTNGKSISKVKEPSKTRIEEGKIVQVADVLKELESMETSLDEDIPWEASDSKMEDSAISEEDDFGLTDYNSLLSKIDSQLKNISEQNQQFELKKKQMENSDDEIEKLLMD